MVLRLYAEFTFNASKIEVQTTDKTHIMALRSTIWYSDNIGFVSPPKYTENVDASFPV
jgi:DNA polymerase IIIc chi subunit